MLNLLRRNGERIFHYLFIITLLVDAMAYFSMASDLGWSVVAQHLRVSEAVTYQVFFAKYIYWVVAFPTIVIALGLASGISWATIIYNVFLTWIWIISYLVGAYTPSRYKWGILPFGTLAYLLLAYQNILSGLSASKRFNLSRKGALDYIQTPQRCTTQVLPTLRYSRTKSAGRWLARTDAPRAGRYHSEEAR